jgi:hypothetical protein
MLWLCGKSYVILLNSLPYWRFAPVSRESDGDMQQGEDTVNWRYEWNAALDESRTTRKPLLIDVMKVP